MKLLVLLFTLSPWIAVGASDNTELGHLVHSTDTNKDMYVINAMVYQVGILTNKSDDTYTNSTGNQEVLTLYHTNGSNIDLSNIPTPLLTNITAQRLVGVAPTLDVGNDSVDNSHATWTTLSRQSPLQAANAENPKETRATRQITSDTDEDLENYNGAAVDNDFNNRPMLMERLFKRPLIMKRDVSKEGKTPIKVVEGSAVIPEEAGVQSIGIPPLLTLNNNLSEIPVPIPNTSVVHYSKINTLVHAL